MLDQTESCRRTGNAEWLEADTEVDNCETIPVRLEPSMSEAIDVWARKQDVPRSEAIRRLVELGLKAKG